jgi:hypothetical protein
LATSSRKDQDIARALVDTLGDIDWEVVALAHGYLTALGGATEEASARVAYERGYGTLRKSRDQIRVALGKGLRIALPIRERTGSAENPVTKLFPAAVTERRFLDLIEQLRARRPTLDYTDDRDAGHTLSDFTLLEGNLVLPINIKNAGTRFEQAASLVQLDPNDCVPIPAYKAHLAVERLPSLLYAVAVDYTLIGTITELLPKLLEPAEVITWEILNSCAGARVRKAEDAFVGRVVRRHWDRIQKAVRPELFHVVSARKAIRILQTIPHRTPGIGLRAWGTSARGEVNVHLSIAEDMKDWAEIHQRITEGGLSNIIEAVNRRHQEWVYDPEI